MIQLRGDGKSCSITQRIFGPFVTGMENGHYLKFCKGGNYFKAHVAKKCDCVKKNSRGIFNTVSIALFNAQYTSGIKNVFSE